VIQKKLDNETKGSEAIHNYFHVELQQQIHFVLLESETLSGVYKFETL